MKKSILVRACGLAAAGVILCGCEASAAGTAVPFQNPTAAPPATTAPAVPDAPIRQTLTFGQTVWSVCRSSDGGDPYLVRYSVVAQVGELVAVVPMHTPDPDKLMQSLTSAAQMPLDGTGHLYLVMADNCYLNPSDAQAAADKEAG